MSLLEKQSELAAPQHTLEEAPAEGAILTERAVERRREIEQVLGNLLQISLEDMPLDGQLQKILGQIVSIGWLTLDAKGAIFLVEDDPRVLVMKAQQNLAPALVGMCARVPFGHCLCGRAASSTRAEFADCLDNRHDVVYEGMKPHGHYCVPIVLRGKTTGVITLYVQHGHRRDVREEEFLGAVAGLVAGIIEHRRMEEALKTAVQDLRQTLGSIIYAMGATLETRDPYTAGHQRRVSRLANAIAMEMGLSPEQVQTVTSAGLIHDIGKIAIPSEILCKPGKLLDLEFELIKLHPKVGYDILKTISFPWPLARIVLQHHERMNGSGYPSGLVGEDILLEARILAVADVVEAMSSCRPYRPALGIGPAIEEITRNQGKLYDARAVQACLRLFSQKAFVLDDKSPSPTR